MTLFCGSDKHNTQKIYQGEGVCDDLGFYGAVVTLISPSDLVGRVRQTGAVVKPGRFVSVSLLCERVAAEPTSDCLWLLMTVNTHDQSQKD